LLKCFSSLPFPLIYSLSDLLYLVAYYLLQYRKQVVFENLNHSFPDKNEVEIKAIAKQFYQALCDWVFEIVKTHRLSKSSLQERCKLNHNQALANLEKEKDGALILSAHFGNWEWAGQVIGLHLDQPVNVVFKKMKNPSANAAMEVIRTQHGNELSHMKNAMRNIFQGKERGMVSCFLADQKPTKRDDRYWDVLLNREAPFFNGPEKIAKKLNIPVYYAAVIPEKQRGYYKVVLHEISRNPNETEPDEITDEYVRYLEETIKNTPHNWLWSHRRWKHLKKKK